jgi:hypothetical protein
MSMMQTPSAIQAVIEQIQADGGSIDVETLINPSPRPARLVPSAALLDVVVRLAGPGADGAEVLRELIEEAQRRGWPIPGVSPSPSSTAAAGVWLSPDKVDLQHGQVWTIRTRGGVIVALAQIDGYDTERGRRYWRAINLDTRRPVQVRHVLQGSCPRVGGRRERAKR